MKSTIVFIFFLFIQISCYSQKKSDIPILIHDNKSFSIPVIRDKGIQDSLKAYFNVNIYFRHPLKDTTMCIIVDSIRLTELTLRSLKDKNIIKIYLFKDNIKTPYERYIWNLCNEKINYWYRNQTYETATSRGIWGKIAAFGGSCYLIPDTIPPIITFP